MSQLRPVASFEIRLACVAGACVALAFVFARAGIPGWIPPAPMLMLGIPSPLTGMTRSFVALASGDVPRAFWFHPLGPVCFAACVVSIVAVFRGAVTGRELRLRLPAVHVGIIVAAIASVWVRQIAVFGG
ncbi:MAG TPA: DUF2752 domain-containing protein [Actinomycetota bacterium]|nr:DUF2752 domain-containing protein [Actinomycetota bacterium]